ncbi:hypothetical protein Dimus_034970 [Dionaea muscipula]
MASLSSEEPQREEEQEKEVIHKTKTIQFRGRTVPIVLQNDNGPCPLIAICNVLLLKNQLSLSPDVGEVSQQKLLAMVAERLLDSNSDVKNKDAGYVENQQQNIADAIDLLPRLTTGIDVNIKFRKIDEFEFTRECAIFDLLAIPLYHGWLVDPQDQETAEAIGSKSYNTLMGELVSLETQKMEWLKNKPEEDLVDFAAATTATLGVPSPSLSRAKSFDDSPHSPSAMLKMRKGDIEEEVELLRALKLSQSTLSAGENDSLVSGSFEKVVPANSDKDFHQISSLPSNSVDLLKGQDHDLTFHQDSSPPGGSDISNTSDSNLSPQPHASILEPPDMFSSKVGEVSHVDQLASGQSGEDSMYSNPAIHSNSDEIICEETPSSPFPEKGSGSQNFSLNNQGVSAGTDSQDGMLTASANVTRENIVATESFSSSFDGNEPIYEGEECILDSRSSACQDREPVYEGEVLLAEQADKGSGDGSNAGHLDNITPRQGELISDFLTNNSSQLTIHGLLSLRGGLQENELCVFFRNNHFSTMFKFDGELYLLATDQGYLNQPELVWEKLNEVNGDTLFMTSNFKEFRLESVGDSIWDEQNAVSSSDDYLGGISNSGEGVSSLESDRLLAESLQQQEYDQHQQHYAPKPTPSSSSRLITGPQVPRTSGKTPSSSSSSSQKPSSKLKDNCAIM